MGRREVVTSLRSGKNNTVKRKSFDAEIASDSGRKKKATSNRVFVGAPPSSKKSPCVVQRVPPVVTREHSLVVSRPKPVVVVATKRKNSITKKEKRTQQEVYSGPKQQTKKTIQKPNPYQVTSHVSCKPSPEVKALKGLNTNLEKAYYRLTTQAKSLDVRSEATCRKALAWFTSKWEADKCAENYEYICEQFKSLRQDIKIQRIQNDLTVTTYETHARIALEVGDFGEFNQCQNQLHDCFYSEPEIASSPALTQNASEFLCYRLLFAAVVRDSISQLANLGLAVASSDAQVAAAVLICKAIQTFDYFTFFNLYHKVNRYSRFILDLIAERFRSVAVCRVVNAYSPATFPICKMAKLLGFGMDNSGRSTCLRFLNSCGVVSRNDQILCKESKPAVDALTLRVGGPLKANIVS